MYLLSNHLTSWDNTIDQCQEMLIKAEQLLSPISREEVRIMGDDHQVFSDNDDNADGLDVVDQLIRDSTIVTTPGAPLGRKKDPAMR